jgi:hypothetical protein
LRGSNSTRRLRSFRSSPPGGAAPTPEG